METYRKVKENVYEKVARLDNECNLESVMETS